MFVLSFPAHALTLEEAWSAAESHSAAAGLVAETERQAGILRDEAWSLVQPRLVAQATYTINDRETVFDTSAFIPPEFADLVEPGDPLVVRKKAYEDWNVSVIQPLMNGQALPLLRGAYANVRAAEATADARRSELRIGVAQAFYGVAVAREAERVAGGAVESARRHLAAVEARLLAGSAAPTARTSAQLALSRAGREAQAAHKAVGAAELALRNLTGADPGEVALPDAPGPVAASLEEALARAEAHRPEILAADAQLRTARMQKIARDLDWIPSAEGRFTYAHTGNTSAFNDREEFWMIVLSANWTIWDGGYRLGEQAMATSQRRQAELAARMAREQAVQATTEAWNEQIRAAAALRAVQDELKLAEENRRIAETAFSAGAVTFVELQDAELGLQAAQLAALNERANGDLAALRLKAAIGGW
jgi:outer membrane protein TolC